VCWAVPWSTRPAFLIYNLLFDIYHFRRQEAGAMNRDELLERTKQFGHRCVRLALTLPENTLGSHIRSQLIRSCTGVGANYRAACIAQSRAAFVSKLSIVIEEVDESCFWMEFLLDEKLLSAQRVAPLLREGKELTAIFTAARHTTRNRCKLQMVDSK
jgi:four helix bundle protein